MTDPSPTTSRPVGGATWTDAALTRACTEALAGAGVHGARVVRLHRLDGGSDRNVVARATLESDDGAVPIVVKATRAADHDPTAPELLRVSGFARELVALRLIDERHVDARGARLLADDAASGVMVLRDLGRDATTLVEPFTGSDPLEAERALLGLADALGTLHAATAGCDGAYRESARSTFAGIGVERAPSLDAFTRLLGTLETRLGGEVDRAELEALSRLWDAPGAWTVLTHGDPCPDNVLRLPDGEVALLDFEFARPGHALSDVAWWHMGFPSCWCAGTVPRASRARADARYREILSRAVPACADQALWADALARLCTIQLLLSAPRVVDAALGPDEPWGVARCRERLLHWLLACGAMLDAARVLPSFRRAIDTWTGTVEGTDTGHGALVPYAAFAPPSPASRLAMAVVVRDGRVLVQRRWRRGVGTVDEFPGGRVERGESPADAARRELHEETGLVERTVVHESAAASRDGGTITFVVFVSDSDVAPRKPGETPPRTFSWLAPGDVPLGTLAPADVAFVRDVLPGLVEAAG